MFKVIDIEQKQLYVKPDMNHIRAGVKMFEELGSFNTIDALAGGDILKHEQVQLLEYNTAFMKLLHNKKTNLFQKNLSEVLKTK